MVAFSRRGVTLTEMMIVVAIVSAVFAIAAPMFLQINRTFIMNRTRIELQQEARAVMYVVTRTLRQAQSDTISIDRVNTSQPFYSKITFTKQQGTTLVFQQEGVYLYQVFGTGKRALSKNLKYLEFSLTRSDDMGIISVSLTLEKNMFEGRKKAFHMASEKVRVMN
ncbi:MAG: prepilin-type N-terminal cleavage/methylation domain-containing protein [Elusimicrobia bacterium]|nr:prepilin-type N-terminal cleavage/methylation domain-containing protein [Elusimicrobiota bacterium]